MKKYTNKSDKLRAIRFEDGDAQFLMRGQSITTDKKVIHLQEGIRVVDIEVQKAVSTNTRKKVEKKVEDGNEETKTNEKE
jgi:hypothetical protein